MGTCTTCNAEFGIKFERQLCSHCGKEFCSAHLIPMKYLEIDGSISANLQAGNGLCYFCIFNIWGKTDENMASPQGIGGRLTNALVSSWKNAKSIFLSTTRKIDLVKISSNSFEDINSNRAWALFRHQQEIGYDFIIQDLTSFARLYAVSQGRRNERDFCLNDVYRLVDWLRSHPRLPDWAHGVTWKTIESSPDGLAYVLDVWHVVSATIILSNPASGLAWAAYHVGDRIVDQHQGNGIFFSLYNKIKDKLGLNINPGKALVVYLAGLFIIQLLSDSADA